ncbi:MAG: CHAT domain-containing protein [Drouetiella hepatica Uher 2000/2452]|jgi:hypothetical protein|uniref:CHAT domain-containing protein n=1 Tax=Drouetiella hepatica Uher 2000/2452 TaxID=904376 RepID=A0A951Q8E6_9CYAN|nr:CHAT domain-containing protein [Drouetiella hepatica Uher 2000/2452]
MEALNQTKILFLSSDPSDKVRLRVGQELREIREKLQMACLRNEIILESREAIRSGDITQAILAFSPHIVHFSGHGMSSGELCIEDRLGKVQTVQLDALASLFKLASKHVKCVVLNTCHSEIQAKAIAQYIPYVVGMSQEIGDKAAIAFSTGFYKAIGADCSDIEKAHEAGCVEIQLENLSGHFIPVLHRNINYKTEAPTRLTVVVTATINRDDRSLVEAMVAHLRKISGDADMTLLEP